MNYFEWIRIVIMLIQFIYQVWKDWKDNTTKKKERNSLPAKRSRKK